MREAIICANTTAGNDIITFNIPGSDPGCDGSGICTIEVDPANIIPANLPGQPEPLAFPQITEQVLIDGYTQGDAFANTNTPDDGGTNAELRIVIQGPGLPNDMSGLMIGPSGSGSTIRGLAMHSFYRLTNANCPGAIVINESDNNMIAGNFLGTDASGTVGTGNVNIVSGVCIFGGQNNLIGGTAPEARNLISANGLNGVNIRASQAFSEFGFPTGIDRIATGNQVLGNLIGTNAAGDAMLLNQATGGLFSQTVGVNIGWGANGNIIGGASAAARTIISGNTRGVNIDAVNGAASQNVVEGNYIGTDVTGQNAVANNDGLLLYNGASANQVLSNVVSANSRFGIESCSFFCGGAGPTSDNVIQANLIGVAADGVSPLGNGGMGIGFEDASGNLIGGTGAGEGNIIANNAVGVHIYAGGFATEANTIHGNSIYGNTQLGIDLGGFYLAPDGPTANDNQDPDSGANQLQNFPVLTSATAFGSALTVQGTFNSTPSTSFTLEFFANSALDPSGHGEGETSLGTQDVTTDAGGDAVFTAPFPSANVPAGSFITATATDPDGNTSEFSAGLEAEGCSLEVTTTADAGAGSLREAINCANGTPGLDTITFAIPSGDAGCSSGTCTITLQSLLPTLTDPAIINGYTQDGASANTNPPNAGSNAQLVVVVTGSLTRGFRIEAGGSTIRGLVVNGFTGAAIEVAAAGGNAIEGNFLHTDASGAASAAGGILSTGVRITDSDDNRIGGTAPAARNVIGSGTFGAGVHVTGDDATGNQILGNLIGTDAAGTSGLGGGAGVFINAGASETTVGGTTPTVRNVISGHTGSGLGVEITNASNNVVSGNFIGTDVTGSQPIPNRVNGVLLQEDATDNLIGGSDPGAGNVISANTAQFGAIDLYSCPCLPNVPPPSGNRIQGNLIGVAADGVTPLPNENDGILVEAGSNNNTIGGANAGEGNVVAASGQNGIRITDAGTTGNVVEGNFIGTDPTEALDLGNTGHGILTASPDPNRIRSNTIAHNEGDGIRALGAVAPGKRLADGAAGHEVSGAPGRRTGRSAENRARAQDEAAGFSKTTGVAAGMAFLGNSIYANDGLGIDLGGDGVTANDADDSDTGPNHLQNFPVLSSAVSTGSTLMVEGMLTSTPSTTFRVEFFANEACDPSGFGEGRVFLGAENVMTNSSGTGGFSVPLSAAVPAGQFVTATATDPADHTSEFSACLMVEALQVAADLGLTKEVQPASYLGQQVTFVVTLINHGPDPATGIEITDAAPPGLVFDTVMPSAGTYAAATGVWSLPHLAVDSSATLTVTATLEQTGSITNTAAITRADQPDPEAGNNAAAATVEAAELIDLSLTKELVDFSEAMGVIRGTFVVIVYNAGPSVATGVVVTDRLPDGMRLTGVTVADPRDIYDLATNRWHVGEVGVGEDALLYLQVEADAGAVLFNQAEVTAAEQDDLDSTPGDGGGDDFGTTQLGRAMDPTRFKADLSLTKTIDQPSPGLDDEAVFTLEVHNAGPSTTAGVEVTDRLPEGLTFVTAHPADTTDTYDPVTGVWTVGALRRDSTATLELVVHVTGAGTITNTAEVTESHLPDPDSFTGNGRAEEDDQASASLTVQDEEGAKLTSVEATGVPAAFMLYGNYPNPFNPQTIIRYALPAASPVRLVVYDGLGRVVEVLLEEEQAAGRYEAVFAASRLPSGVYFYRLTAGDFTQVRTMLLVK